MHGETVKFNNWLFVISTHYTINRLLNQKYTTVLQGGGGEYLIFPAQTTMSYTHAYRVHQ